jgi:hypothetical protein
MLRPGSFVDRYPSYGAFWCARAAQPRVVGLERVGALAAAQAEEDTARAVHHSVDQARRVSKDRTEKAECVSSREQAVYQMHISSPNSAHVIVLTDGILKG